jgi:hypothetical protein
MLEGKASLTKTDYQVSYRVRVTICYMLVEGKASLTKTDYQVNYRVYGVSLHFQ